MTLDTFHNARYWKDYKKYILTPIVALETKHVIALVQRMKTRAITPVDIRELFDTLLKIQIEYKSGPSWYEAYSKLYEQWIKS